MLPLCRSTLLTRRALGQGLLFAALVAIAFAAAADEQGQIDFADGLFARGLNEDAAEEYHTYLREYPQGKYRLSALYRLGEAETALAHYAAAIEAFDRAIATDVKSEFVQRSVLRKSAVLIKLERPDEAVKLLGALAGEQAPADVLGEALYFLGKAHAEAGRAASAINAFSRLAREHAGNPFVPMARYQLAFVYIAQGNFEKAAIEFSEVAQLTTGGDALRMESYFRAAEIYDKLTWFDSAVKAYEALERDYPNSSYAHRARYGHSWALYEAGKLEEATAASKSFATDYPDSAYRAGFLYLLGNCLQQAAQYDGALEAFKELCDAFPESEFAARSQFKMAWVYYLNDDRASAKGTVNAYLGLNTKDGLKGDALFLKGSILYDEGAYLEACDVLEDVYTSFPDNEFASDAVFKRGDALMRLGLHEQAAQAHGHFADTYPKHARAIEAHLRAGDAHFALKDYGAAAQRYERALSETATGPAHEEALYRLAIAWHNQGSYAESAAAFENLLGEYPEGKFSAEANLRRGNYLLREGGDAMKAIPYFEAAYNSAADGPHAGSALKGLALARYDAKDYDGAAKSFLQLMTDWESISLNEKTYAWVGEHSFNNEDWEPAIVAFEALLQHVPEYPNPERVLYKIAECAENAGRSEEAVKRYRRVVDTAPTSATAMDAKYRMALQLEKSDNLDAALPLYLEGAEANNSETAARSRFRLGEIFEERGEYQTAAKHFMRVAILFFHPELSPESLWRAGQCFEKSENFDQARKTYTEVLEEYPESAPASLARERLNELAAA